MNCTPKIIFMCTRKKDCKYNRLNSLKHEQGFHFDLELIFTRCGVHLLKHAILGCLSFVRIGWLDWLVHKCDASVLPNSRGDYDQTDLVLEGKPVYSLAAVLVWQKQCIPLTDWQASQF